jgi:hypothetical protein
MKLEWNPLDIKPVAELTIYGDARPAENFRIGQVIDVNGSPYRVTDGSDDGDSVTYKLEPAWLDGEIEAATAASPVPHGTAPPSSASPPASRARDARRP